MFLVSTSVLLQPDSLLAEIEWLKRISIPERTRNVELEWSRLRDSEKEGSWSRTHGDSSVILHIFKKVVAALLLTKAKDMFNA